MIGSVNNSMLYFLCFFRCFELASWSERTLDDSLNKLRERYLPS